MKWLLLIIVINDPNGGVAAHSEMFATKRLCEIAKSALIKTVEGQRRSRRISVKAVCVRSVP